MRTDFENLSDGDHITLYPNSDNPIHSKPVNAYFFSGYFCCDGTPPEDGPDYYWGDVFRYNDGFEIADSKGK